MKEDNKEIESKNRDFLRFILEDASAEEMHHTFKRNNIQPKRFSVFQKFILTLVDTVYDTYLGQDCIYREADIVGHFTWCFKKTCSLLKLENFRFEENQELHDYFMEFFRLNMYLCESSRETTLAYFHSIFHMDTHGKMKHSDLSAFVDLYEMFDKTTLRGRNLVTSR